MHREKDSPDWKWWVSFISTNFIFLLHSKVDSFKEIEGKECLRFGGFSLGEGSQVMKAYGSGIGYV